MSERRTRTQPTSRQPRTGAHRSHQLDDFASADLKPAVHSPETAGLGRLIRVMIAATGTFAAVMGVTWAVSGDVNLGASALVDAGAVVAAGLGWFLLSRGRLIAAVTVVTVGILGTAILLAAVPPATPALAALPLLGGSIALQYVSGGTLRRLLLLSWSASVLVAVIVEFVPVAGPLPDWYYPFMRVASFAAVTGTTVILLGQFGSRLRASLARSEAMRKALAQRQDLLLNVIEGPEAAMFAVDLEYCYTIFNSRHADVMRALHGVDIELGRSILDYQSSSGDHVLSKMNIDRALAGERFTDEGFSGGDERGRAYFEIMYGPVRDEAGRIIGASVFARDTTEGHRIAAELADSQAEVAFEAQARATIAESLHLVGEASGLGESGQAICDGLAKLPGIGLAVIEVALGPTDIQIISVAAPTGYPVKAGDHLPPAVSAFVLEAVKNGPWAGYTQDFPAGDGWRRAVAATGMKAIAQGPIFHGGMQVGAIAIGTFDTGFAKTLVEKMPAVVAVSSASSALLAGRLHDYIDREKLRRSLATVLTAGAFHPVFQPIVELESRETVGFEALTRFDSGQRPDLCFAEARAVDLGPELELATLGAAIAEARKLPAGRWLSLNISPRLLLQTERLKGVLWPSERPIFLEITEHEIIEDYGAVAAATRALGHGVRLAVDDAGAGIANFGHIVELRANLVKLDMGLVRDVNSDLGRQAMVVGMRHFARQAGCRLLAEGIETEQEAAALRQLAVELGQGYLFGRPSPAETWATPGKTARRQPPGRGSR
jgi:EAL domain-containing protein (putative c-di-GMP-specific phosphodiesterase class I)